VVARHAFVTASLPPVITCRLLACLARTGCSSSDALPGKRCGPLARRLSGTAGTRAMPWAASAGAAGRETQPCFALCAPHQARVPVRRTARSTCDGIRAISRPATNSRTEALTEPTPDHGRSSRSRATPFTVEANSTLHHGPSKEGHRTAPLQTPEDLGERRECLRHWRTHPAFPWRHPPGTLHTPRHTPHRTHR
jgi:hypothetical protein